MKCLLILAVLTVGVYASYPEWISFKQSHGKKYKNPAEERNRMNVFLKNKAMIEKHNKDFENGLTTYQLKMNHFGDLTVEEYRAQMNTFKRQAAPRNGRGGRTEPFIPSNDKLPEHVDWREKGAVTPVKYQGQCGSCWAFSVAASLEGQYFLESGKLLSLSEQIFLDCGKSTYACAGGSTQYAFMELQDNITHIVPEDVYPYEAKKMKCRYQNSTAVATLLDFKSVPYSYPHKEQNELALMKAVATVGPISVCMDAGHDTYQFYYGGIYTDPKCSMFNVNHCVLLVGYGSENGTDYWLIKNSYTARWGEKGYMKLLRNGQNFCGITEEARYPLVKVIES